MKFEFEFLARGCAGELRSGSADRIATGVSTDSRTLQPGDVFFALRGNRYDGHEFLEGAMKRGAVALVVERNRLQKYPRSVGVIEVDDTRRALGILASGHRNAMDCVVIGVAGSNGKTTTKELIAAMIREEFPTISSEASFNNEVGVPMTLLRLTAGDRVAVVELGTNHPGELEPLVRMAKPSIGVLTQLGREHLEHFGDLNGVIREEAVLAEGLPRDGKLVAWGDSLGIQEIVRRTQAGVVKVGWSDESDWRIGGITFEETGTVFRVTTPHAAWDGEYRVGLPGRHMVGNTVLALAVAMEAGVSPAAARRGLVLCRAARGRLELSTVNGFRILDDSYNANPDSMLAALRTLSDLPCSGRRVAVLGDMAELGCHAEAAHREVGNAAAAAGVDWLVAVGVFADWTAMGARSGGLHKISQFETVEGVMAELPGLLRVNDLVLVKASRSSRLERVVAEIRRQLTPGYEPARTRLCA